MATSLGVVDALAARTGGGARDARSSALLGPVLLALAATSVAGGLSLLPADMDVWVALNRVPEGDRRVLFTVMGATFAFVFSTAAAVRWRKGAAVEPTLTEWGLRLSPLCLAYLVPFLFAVKTWTAQPLTFLCLLSALGLSVERLLRVSLRQPRVVPELGAVLRDAAPGWVRRFAPATVVLLGALFYTVYTAHFCIQQHQRLATLAFDLGIYDNLLFNAMHGHFFRSPVLFGPEGGNYIAGHAEFIMVAFVPFYALWPRPEMLLIMQSALLGFAAFPLYKFARTQVPPWTAVVVALAYLLYAPLHGPNFYDFHWLPLAVFFHFWLYFALATDRLWLAVPCVLAALLTREDVSVGLVLLGSFLAITGIRVRLGIVLAAVSVVYFGVVKFVIMPWAGPWWFSNLYKDLIPNGESGYGGVMRTILTNPFFFVGTLLSRVKLAYALHLFAPVVFLPWRRAALALLASAGFFFTLMTTGYEPTVSIAFQYTTHWIPYVFAATVLALRLLGSDVVKRRAATVALAFSVLAHSYVFGCLLQRNTFVGGFVQVPFKMTDAERKRYADMVALVSHIPKDASVAATESEVPHVSSRVTAYALRDNHGAADFLLVSRDMMGHVHTKKTLIDAFTHYTYGLVERRGTLFLFERGRTSPETEPALKALGIHLP